MNDLRFRKAACATFDVKIGDIEANKKNIIDVIKKAAQQDVDILVFPELCLTAYSCADMFLRHGMVERAMMALLDIAEETKETDCVAVVGTPVKNAGKLFNCAAIINDGRICAVVPKSFLPSYNEFYERRWFHPAADANKDTVRIGQDDIPFGCDIIVETSDGMKIGCEICEDLWVIDPPSNRLAMAGANIIVNPSASNDIVSKKEYRRDLVRMHSGSCNLAYIYASAGSGESTTDVVYSGHHLIAECGSLRADVSRYLLEEAMITTAIIDLEKIENDQIRMNSFSSPEGRRVRTVRTERKNMHQQLPLHVNAYPFVPASGGARKQRCEEILALQATGLASRLKKTGMKKCVIGISGGLDSTLALLVIKEAFEMIGNDMKNIIAITMPGFGTTKQTKSSADDLMRLVGADQRTVDITAACRQHMKDIGQPEDVYDVTFENIQARERTQILMDVANKEGGLVVGTGDLSELALGWCTYNGDHMSMYGVNASIPKTLVRFIIETYADEKASPEMAEVLRKVCGTVISPELLPPDENGNIRQSTEAAIGKYDLHDFFLYNYIRNGFAREKIEELACIAFPDIDRKQIKDTLSTFMRRFRISQFKRSCIPDGPKVGSVALSPRGDWRMPSDYDFENG